MTPAGTAPSGGELAGALRAATEELSAAGIASARADAVALAAHLLCVGPGEVERRAILGALVPQGYDALVAARSRRVPLQHLTGVAHFRRLTLQVGPGVFSPRPETEVLVGLALGELARLSGLAGGHPSESSGVGLGVGPIVVDLCTGSGAIALAVADEAPGAQVHAIELSPAAHAWAQRNVAGLGLPVDLALGDAQTAFPELLGRVDVVTCNPPYIPLWAEPVDPEVRDHDPELALYGEGPDGLDVARRMANRAADLLRPGGLLLMEHGDAQGESLPQALLAAGPWAQVEDVADLSGRPRVTRARRRPVVAADALTSDF